ncbi:MAG TPA: hypothetical protein PKE69_10010 [Pyrinomonadaceae bacterium]|nr:hypothetical protein [Pyrinomonadaceae bacterium]
MKKHCLDSGTIQAFLDGELNGGLLETAADHLAVCDDCAMLLGNAEEESAIAFTALNAELNTLVPTQRLWAKINIEIEKEKKSYWQTVFAFFKNPTIATFASLMIVFGVFMAYISSQANNNQQYIAINTENKSENITPISDNSPSFINPPEETSSGVNTVTRINQPEKTKPDFRVIKAVVIENQPIQIQNKKTPDKVVPQTTAYQYLPGEEGYIKTIATLENNLNSRKDEVLKPSERFTFEQNLAVVDDSITKMRKEVKKNPRNQAAKQILMASYQNKVDLLNSVTEKNELMALR